MVKTECEDLEAVIRNVAGARNAFVRRYAGVVGAAAAKINIRRNDFTVEDVEMELWQKVFEKECFMLRKYNGSGSFEGYLRRCLAFKATDIIRSANRRGVDCIYTDYEMRCGRNEKSGDKRAALVEGLSSEMQPAFDDEPRAERIAALKEAFAQLPSDQRLILAMLYYDKASHQAVADFFGLSSAQIVYSRKFRILRALRKAVVKKLKELHAVF